jgi:predicted RNase H-like HicB family nuclease
MILAGASLMLTKVALPLTFLFSYHEESRAWASVACEISVASCGDSIDEARDMLKDAVRIHVSSMVKLGHLADLADPESPESIAELLAVPPEHRAIEYHTAILRLRSEPGPRLTSLQFLPTAVKPVCCQHPVAA